MTTVLHTRPFGRFIEILSNLRSKKRHKANQGSRFIEDSFSNRDNVTTAIQFKSERQPHHLKR